MIFFILDDEQAPVQKLLDGGRFMEAGEGLERGWGVVRHDDQYYLRCLGWAGRTP